MNRRRPFVGRRGCMRGISIVEMMVSLLIGLIVVAAVCVSYLGSGQSGTQQAAWAQMNEDAQIGLAIIGRDLMLAGYSKPTSASSASGRFAGTPADAVFGCDHGFETPNKLGALLPAVDCAVEGDSASLEVVYEPDVVNTVAQNSRPSDCIGNTVRSDRPLDPSPWLRNRYYVADSTYTGTARPELHCASNVPNSEGNRQAGEPLVENVERLQLRYLEAVLSLHETAPADQRYRYTSASQVVDWGRVIAVRVCLLMRSAEPVRAAEDSANASYLDCDLQPQTPVAGDRHLRRAYFGTVALRNKIPL